MSSTLTFVIAAPPELAPVPSGRGRVTQFSILTELSATDPFLTLRLSSEGEAEGNRLLARAVGPSRAPLGVGRFLANPNLKVLAESASVTANDDWNGDPVLAAVFAAAGAFPFVHLASTDAALVVPAPAENREFRVSSAGDPDGMVLLEVFQLAPATESGAGGARLHNGSFQHRVGADTTLSLGFVISGPIGTTIAFRVSDRSDDSAENRGAASMVLFNASGVEIAASVNLVGESTGELSTMIATLLPGTYYVEIRNNGPSVLALVEWFEQV